MFPYSTVAFSYSCSKTFNSIGISLIFAPKINLLARVILPALAKNFLYSSAYFALASFNLYSMSSNVSVGVASGVVGKISGVGIGSTAGAGSGFGVGSGVVVGLVSG